MRKKVIRCQGIREFLGPKNMRLNGVKFKPNIRVNWIVRDFSHGSMEVGCQFVWVDDLEAVSIVLHAVWLDIRMSPYQIVVNRHFDLHSFMKEFSGDGFMESLLAHALLLDPQCKLIISRDQVTGEDPGVVVNLVYGDYDDEVILTGDKAKEFFNFGGE